MPVSSRGYRPVSRLPGQQLPQTRAVPMPTEQVGQFQNQQLAGLMGGATTGIRPRSPGADPMISDGPSQVSAVGASAKRQVMAVQGSNDRLMQYAQQAGAKRRDVQAKQAALQRASSRTYQGPQGGGGGAPQRGQAPAGGITVHRIQRILPRFPGLRITEVGGDRERDRRHGVPRHANSFHYDSQNPAVDIGGPTAQLDALYRQLKAEGGWRQILWRVPGHYDHIHIA